METSAQHRLHRAFEVVSVSARSFVQIDHRSLRLNTMTEGHHRSSSPDRMSQGRAPGLWEVEVPERLAELSARGQCMGGREWSTAQETECNMP